MGILVINVTTMAGPGIASMTPDWNGTATPIDWATFTFTWLFFEGKMRAIFAALFGASLVLYLDRGERETRLLRQVRRLLWLAVFGYLHFLLFWWGDILFTYAIAGMIALLFRAVAPWRLLGMGGAIYAVVSLLGFAEASFILGAAHSAASGSASPETAGFVAKVGAALNDEAAVRMAEYAMGFGEAAAYRLHETPFFPFMMAARAVPEALPLMLCGMGLARTGFFAGEWPRRTMVMITVIGAVVGLGWYGAMFAYAASQGFRIETVAFLPFQIGFIGRFAMAAAILAGSVMLAPALLRGGLGRRAAAAGRMALSNYLGCSVSFAFLFNGWGLGLGEERYGHAVLMLFVLLGWAAMLAWSRPWLDRLGIGPLEYLWRRLSGMRIRRISANRG